VTDDRSPRLLHTGALSAWRTQHGNRPLTDSEAHRFLLGRAEAWYVIPKGQEPCGLLEFLGMTSDEFVSWQVTHVVPARVRRIWDLGEPQRPGPGPDGKQGRRCPVGPYVCGVIIGWAELVDHIHEHHTTGSPEARQEAVQRILEGRSGAREQAAAVVPKVTADPRTAALYALTQGDRTRAREAIGQLGTTDRRAYLTQLTELINMLWGELG
jgi:hypothetical protein